jgi:hypothetical protein
MERLRDTDNGHMPRFCIVVKSPNEELYRALEEVLAGRIGFRVLRDRRGSEQKAWPRDRRKARVWEYGELVLAECED